MPAIIFDLNGVFIKSRPLSERIEQDYGVPTAEFLPVLASVMEIVRRPGADDVYEYFRPHLQRWNIALSREAFLSYWFDAEQEDAAMVEFACGLHQGWNVFALSNNFKERTRYYDKRFAFLGSIKTYYSWQTGNVKPDVRCFQQILDENEVTAGDCYYFDDAEKNVAAARTLGIQAYRFEGLEQVKRITGC